MKSQLDGYYSQFNNPDFINKDPISIPHFFSKKEDIEISAFLVSTIAWGNRTSIISNGNKLMKLMDNAPCDFIKNHEPSDLKPFESFVHRTFNGSDVQFFITSLKNIYSNNGGLENAFSEGFSTGNGFDGISRFRELFFSLEHLNRVEKHISNPAKNSACKRLNMFLRWMVRRDEFGVDFGIWSSISPAILICPLDLHTARVSRKLGLVTRLQNDRQTAEELTRNLSYFCPEDPIKYDFALFGAGVNGIL